MRPHQYQSSCSLFFTFVVQRLALVLVRNLKNAIVPRINAARIVRAICASRFSLQKRERLLAENRHGNMAAAVWFGGLTASSRVCTFTLTRLMSALIGPTSAYSAERMSVALLYLPAVHECICLVQRG